MWEVQVVIVLTLILTIPLIARFSKKKNIAEGIREKSTFVKFICFISLYSLWISSTMMLSVFADFIDGSNDLSLGSRIIGIIAPLMCFLIISNYEDMFLVRFHTMNFAQFAKVFLLYFWFICFNLVIGLGFFLFLSGTLLWFGSEQIIDSAGLLGVFFVGINFIAIYFFWKSLKFDGNKSLND
jgi:hypothetical protein